MVDRFGENGVRRRLSTGEVAVHEVPLPPGVKLLDEVSQRFAKAGQRVLDPRRDLRENLTMDDAVSFEFAQLTSEYPRSDGTDSSLQLTEPKRPLMQVLHRRHLPSPANNGDRHLNRADRRRPGDRWT